ncbi:hypothetical protein DFJ73DRAFT_174237 [Zopfochytrium polystomum]|nr:hypothetical protein DFJ73DRAFT_174237 [Zopfochytrium polystomum]
MLMHFTLTTQSRTHPAVAFSFAAVPLISTLLIFRGSLPAFFAGLLHIRVMELVTLEKRETLKWRWVQYCEFLATGHATDPSKPNPNAVPAAKRTLSFHLRQSAFAAACYIVLCFCASYLVKYKPFDVVPVRDASHGPNTSPHRHLFADPTKPKQVLDVVVFGVALWTLMEVIDFCVILPFCEVLQIDYVPCMRAPFLATSLRDFWSRRWNGIVKSMLHRLVFLPLAYIFDAASSVVSPTEAHGTATTAKAASKSKVKADDSAASAAAAQQAAEAAAAKATQPAGRRRKSHVATTLAALTTFLLSGAFHELVVLVLLNPPNDVAVLRFEQVGFFAAQGAACVVEGAVVAAWRRALRRPTVVAPLAEATTAERAVAVVRRVVGWTFMACCLIGTGPMFIRQYLESGALEQAMVAFPPALVNAFEALLP